MSSTSFLSSSRKGSGNLSSRILKELANKVQKLYAANVVIQDEGLLDQGRMAKGRLLVQDRLRYMKQISGAVPAFYVPFEPDGQIVKFWIKANHTGLLLQDLSTFDNDIITKKNRHFCIVDSGGLDVGYLGTFNGVPSSPCWRLNGVDDTAQVTDAPRLQVKGTTTGFSVTAWVKIADFSQLNGMNRRIMAKTDDANNAYVLSITSTNKAIWVVKFAGLEYKVETPETIQLDTWYFIAATFDSATPTVKIYLNGTVSTTPFVASVTYPTVNSKLQLFSNGDSHVGEYGAFSGNIRDIRIYREYVLTADDVSRFNTNRNTISNIPLGGVMIAGYTWTPGDMDLSSFTSVSFTDTSFNL